MIRGRVRRKHRTIHVRMFEPPVTATGLGHAETAASESPPRFPHLTTCRHTLSPWQAADGEQPFPTAKRVDDPRCQERKFSMRILLPLAGQGPASPKAATTTQGIPKTYRTIEKHPMRSCVAARHR
jgi:hypothetical protein